MSLSRFLPAIGLLALAACGGEPETSAPAAPTLTLEAPEIIGANVWAVDQEASSVGFRGTMNGKDFTGDFSNFAIGVALNPIDPTQEGIIEARIDLGSVDTRDSEKNDALPKETWFHIEAHPVATFRADEINSTGAGTYEAVGSLSLKGISQPVTLPFSLEIDDATGNAVADASVTLNRADFSVGTGEFAEGKWVAFDVEVLIHIEASQQG